MSKTQKKAQYSYMELPEFQEGEKAYQEVRQACGKVKELIEGNVEFVLTAAIRLQGELGAAQKVLDTARSKLISEEMRNKPSPETTAKVKEATIEVQRITETLEAISRSGGLALMELQKKADRLRIKIYEAENLKRGVSSVYPGLDSNSGHKHTERDKKIKQLNTDIVAMKSELESLESSISILKKNQEKYGKLLAVDEDTSAVVQEVVKAVARAWKLREELRLKLVDKLEKRKDDLEDLKAELYDIEQAISGLDPSYLGDVIHFYEIGVAAWPELYANLDKYEGVCVARSNEIDYIKHQITMRIRRTVRQLEQEQKEGSGTV